jgi:primosomal protein DnaI
VGKSYLLGAIANELAKKQISSMIVYVPELFRELKSSIGDSTLNEKVEALKNEPILMMDDIGAEAVSSWTRDEILGPVLQFRMLENLPTFFTSNFDFKGLEHHLAYSQRGEEEKLKARRILERIRYLSEPIEVDGPNRRL